MQASEIKQQLNQDNVMTLLSTLGCEHIKNHTKYISANRPSGDNKSGIVVYLDSEFQALMPTTSEFDNFVVKDIISIVQQLQSCSFPVAMKYICNALGFEYYNSCPVPKNLVLSWLDSIEKGMSYRTKDDEEVLKVWNSNILQQYIDLPHDLWLSVGATIEEMNRFHIMYDVIDNGIIIPIYNEVGDLVGVKVRLIEPLDNKFYYPYSTVKTRILYGLYQNYQEIQLKKCCLIYEAEKSVILSSSFGFKNCVSMGGKTMSDYQCEQLIRLNVPLILCLDKDVTDDELDIIIKKLTFPFPIVPLYVLQDKDGIYLKDKESPADNFEFLKNYKQFIRKVSK